MADLECCGTEFGWYVLIIIGLVLFAGLMAGLTLGLMSLGLVDLEVLIESGRPQDRIHASKIFPVVKNQHLLLCTLLIGNSLAMESLPIFLHKLLTPWAAILISVTLVLMFGEILPHAICSRYGLTIGGTMAPFVRLLLWLFFPVAYPISKAGKGGELTHDERIIIAGALQLAEKTAKDAMTPISKAFSLDLDETLTLDTLNAITTMGHSRVPVYYKDPRNIIGLILVKNLLAVDPENETLLRKMLLRKIPRVSENMPLYDILNEFQKGHSHIAVVYKDIIEFQKDSQDLATESDTCKVSTDENQQQKKISLQTPAFRKRHKGCSFCILDLLNNPIPELISNQQVVGVISMEDVIEELLQEILDETDEYANIYNRIRVNVHAMQENDSDSYSALPFLASAPLSVSAA